MVGSGEAGQGFQPFFGLFLHGLDVLEPVPEGLVLSVQFPGAFLLIPFPLAQAVEFPIQELRPFVMPTLQTFATLLDAALTAGTTRVARELLERAREELDLSDALRLERRLSSA